MIFLRLFAFISAFYLFLLPAKAQNRCALSLVLAIDVSSSVNAEEYRLQMDGIATALRDPEVRQAIIISGGIQLYAYEWSGARQQEQILPWQYLGDDKAIFAAAEHIGNHPRVHSDLPTALGFALGFSALRLQEAPIACARQVVDVSGDGVSNEGYPPALAYKNFVFDGVQVNGLVIAGADPDPVAYFQENVIFGPGAFVETASDFDDYGNAMKRKLLREINGSALSMVR